MVSHSEAEESSHLLSDKDDRPLHQNGDRSASGLSMDSGIRKKLLLAYIFYGNFAVFLCESIPTTFLTTEVLQKGGTTTESSILQQIPMLAMAISSAVFGKYQNYTESKSLLLVGLVFFVLCQASFGILDFSHNLQTLVAVGIVIRLIQGIAQGAYLVASLTIVCQEFTDHVAKVFSITEVTNSIGYITGPMLGNVLYSLSNNMMTPFLVSSGALTPLIPTAFCLLGRYRCTKPYDGEVIKNALWKPGAIFVAGSVITGYGVFTVIAVFGGVYMLSHGLIMLEVGTALLTGAMGYGVSCVVSGFVGDIGPTVRRSFYLFGIIGVLGSIFFFSPSPMKYDIYVGMALNGIFEGLVIVCGFNEFFHLALGDDEDLKSDFSVHSALSGVWNSALGTGGFAFPLIASLLVPIMQFRFALLSCFGIGMSLSILPNLLWAMARKRRMAKQSSLTD